MFSAHPAVLPEGAGTRRPARPRRGLFSAFAYSPPAPLFHPVCRHPAIRLWSDMLGLRRGDGSMRRLSLIVLSVRVVAGCGTATVPTTRPLPTARPPPDHVLVPDFGERATAH